MSERTGLITDQGVVQRAVALGLQKYGCCLEKTWPYIPENVNVKPSDKAFAEAREWTVVPLRIPCTIQAIETCLHNQLPVIIDIILLEEAGIAFHPNGRNSRMPNVRTGLIDRDRFHSIVIVGYDRRKRYFCARNSWGEDWVGVIHFPEFFMINLHLIFKGRRRIFLYTVSLFIESSSYQFCGWSMDNQKHLTTPKQC